jgi:hypothetical protein
MIMSKTTSRRAAICTRVALSTSRSQARRYGHQAEVGANAGQQTATGNGPAVRRVGMVPPAEHVQADYDALTPEMQTVRQRHKTWGASERRQLDLCRSQRFDGSAR